MSTDSKLSTTGAIGPNQENQDCVRCNLSTSDSFVLARQSQSSWDDLGSAVEMDLRPARKLHVQEGGCQLGCAVRPERVKLAVHRRRRKALASILGTCNNNNNNNTRLMSGSC